VKTIKSLKSRRDARFKKEILNGFLDSNLSWELWKSVFGHVIAETTFTLWKQIKDKDVRPRRRQSKGADNSLRARVAGRWRTALQFMAIGMRSTHDAEV
jgi:hypothetical protein